MFLKDVNNLNLSKFRQQCLFSSPDRIAHLELQQYSFYNKSHSNLKIASQKNSALLLEISRLKSIASQPKNELLTRLLLVAKIVAILEKNGDLALDVALQIKDKMLRNPLDSVLSIIAVLVKLQVIAPQEQEKPALEMLDNVIHMTLKQLGFTEGNEALVFLLRDELFEKEYLEWLHVEPVVDDSLARLSAFLDA